MNTGVPETPDQAAQSLWVVRLVSFGSAASLAALVLVAIASLRYAPFVHEEPASVSVLTAIEPAPRSQQPPPQQERRPRERASETSDAPIESPAVSAPSEPVTITDPVWVSRPRNLARFYPREAFMRGLNGQVVLDCVVETTGRLTCTIASETPDAQGFGNAALAIAAEHVMRPALQNGAPVRGRYRMIVPFTAG